MEIFLYFFLIFVLLALAISYLTKKSFVVSLGNMFMVAAVIIVIWSVVIDNGSRRGMEALVLAIMWAMAAGSFLVGFVLRKIGVSQSKKNASEAESIVKTEESE